MLICWTIAGWIIGQVGIQFIAGMIKATTDWKVDFMFGFVGALTAYTILGGFK